MTDKPTFPPKPGRIALPLDRVSLPKAIPPRRGFDPARVGGPGPSGPKGPKGRPIPLPGKSRGRG